MKTYKNSIKNFRQSIRFIVSIITSREFAFIYCVLGTFTQIAHTYFLTSSISSFDGFFKILQATLLSTFISSSLLYFVSIMDNSDTDENKRIRLGVNIFMYIEILINLYYYSRHLLIDSEKIQVFDFIFAIIISGLIPVTIKLYASHIRAKEWFTEIMEEETKTAEVTNKLTDEEHKLIDLLEEEIELLKYHLNEKMTDNLTKNDLDKFLSIVDAKVDEKLDAKTDNKMTEETLENYFNEKMNNLDKSISSIYEKQNKLFMSQFENKVKLLMNKSLD